MISVLSLVHISLGQTGLPGSEYSAGDLLNWVDISLANISIQPLHIPHCATPRLPGHRGMMFVTRLVGWLPCCPTRYWLPAPETDGIAFGKTPLLGPFYAITDIQSQSLF